LLLSGPLVLLARIVGEVHEQHDQVRCHTSNCATEK
jgi:hypothetical protein